MKITVIKKGATIKGLDDWKKLGGPKDVNKQWKKGRSAYELANFVINNQKVFVQKIQSVLEQCGLQSQDFECEPEAISGLGKGMKRGGSRNHDLLMIGENCVIAIEAKVSESFDKLIKDVYNDQKKKSDETRAECLWKFLAEDRGYVKNSEIGYQLFTATRGTMCSGINARKNNCIMLVLVFKGDVKKEINYNSNCKCNENDYNNFIETINADSKGKIARTIENSKINCWIKKENIII